MNRVYIKNANLKNARKKTSKNGGINRLSLRGLVKTMKEFGDTTTLHGIPFITKTNYHWSETFLWILIVMAASSCACTLIIHSWVRYNDNPTVISLEKNYRDWNVGFPAATVCYLQKMNETYAHNFITEKWKAEPNTSEYIQHMEFLDEVTNLSYDRVGLLAKYAKMKEYASFTGKDLSEIARQLTDDSIQYRSETELNMDFLPVVTEMGLCYAYGANVSYYHTLETKPPKNLETMTCNYTTPLCEIRIELLEEYIKDIQVFIHGPEEIADLSLTAFNVKERMQLELRLQQFEMVSAPEIRNLRQRQRRCKFSDEPAPGDKFYSYNLCKMNCRKQMLMELCGCAPFYYTNQKKGIYDFCGLKGLGCVAQQDDIILEQTRNNSMCPCLPMCNTVIYRLAGQKATEWGFPAPETLSFSWTLETFAKTRTKRNIIFGIDDLLVSFGGIAALFLGCSVISFVETINFFFLRPFWNLFKNPASK